MKKEKNIKSIIGISFLVIFALVIIFSGYRVVMTSAELPGRIMSVPAASVNVGYSGYVFEAAKKIDYARMRYGYMDGLMLAQMDYVDKFYENERMEEIRAVNNLTAMSLKTADTIAYETAKAEQEKLAEEARAAAAAADLAREARIQQIVAEINARDNPVDEQNYYIDTGDDSDTGSGDTRSNGGRKGEPVYATSHGKSLGKFVITAYCTCKICCGIYSGGNRTASGTVPTTNRTLAVDTDVIPFRTRLVINGQIYVAEDRGSAIKGKRIDMFYYTHKEALRWGKRTMEVFLAE